MLKPFNQSNSFGQKVGIYDPNRSAKTLPFDITIKTAFSRAVGASHHP